jgi:hypothetical protein
MLFQSAVSTVRTGYQKKPLETVQMKSMRSITKSVTNTATAVIADKNCSGVSNKISFDADFHLYFPLASVDKANWSA